MDVALDRVRLVYQDGGQLTVAVDDISLTVEAGTFVVLTGPSGSGKSTLLNLMSGLDLATSGAVAVGGMDLAQLTATERALLRRRHFGRVFQAFHLLSGLTVAKNVAFTQTLLGAQGDTDALLHEVGLDGMGGRRPQTLSHGQQQRVAIARAIAHHPSVLLADEPTGNLDRTQSRAIFDLMRRLCRDLRMTVVVATHDPSLLDPASDTQVELEDGHIIGILTPPGVGPPSGTAAPSPPVPPAGRPVTRWIWPLAWDQVRRRIARHALVSAAVAIAVAATVLVTGGISNLQGSAVTRLTTNQTLRRVMVYATDAPAAVQLFTGSAQVANSLTQVISARDLHTMERWPGVSNAYVLDSLALQGTVAGKQFESNVLPAVLAHQSLGRGQIVVPRASAAYVTGGHPQQLVGRTIDLKLCQFPNAGSHLVCGRPLRLHVVGIVGGTSYMAYEPYYQAISRLDPAAGVAGYTAVAVMARQAQSVPGLAQRARALGLFPVTLGGVIHNVLSSVGVLETSLTAAGVVLFLVAMALVYSVTTISVLERRRDIGVLLSLGVTPHEVSRLVVLQAILVGGIGALVGICIGLVLDQAVLPIYATLVLGGTPSSGALPWQAIGLGLVLGFGVSWASALIPSRRAAALQPGRLIQEP